MLAECGWGLSECVLCGMCLAGTGCGGGAVGRVNKMEMGGNDVDSRRRWKRPEYSLASN